MKVQNDLQVALQNANATKNKQQVDGFEALFVKELGQSQGVTPATSEQVQAKGLVDDINLHNLLPTEVSSSAIVNLHEVASRMDNMFTSMDQYAEYLGSSDNTALRSAYNLLEGLSADVATLKANNPELANQNPELAAMVNELDILTTTETFKFNRGDYL